MTTLSEKTVEPGAPDFVAAVKEAAIAAAVMAVLALPLIGFVLLDVTGGVTLGTRFGAVAAASGIVFAGRLAIALLRGRMPSVIGDRVGAISKGVAKAGLGRWLAPALVGFAAVLPLMPFSDRYIVDLGTSVLIYVMLGWGLNVVVGLAGLLDLGYVAFYAVGAYSFALLAQHFDLSFWQCLPLAGAFAASFGVILGFPVLRLRGDYLAIVTLGFGEIIRIAANNDFLGLTNGAKGLSTPLIKPIGLAFLQDATFLNWSIPALGFNFRFSVNLYWYFVVVLLCLFTVFIVKRLDDSRLGRSWTAMREDEVAASSVGVNIRGAKLWAFSLGAVWGGLAGVVFANFQGFVSPESFTFMESVFIVSMVVLGGMGSISGVIVGAILLTSIPELIRWAANLPAVSKVLSSETVSLVSNYRMLVFAALMVIMMAVRPQGMIPSQRRSRELHPEDAKILGEEDQTMWDIERGEERSEHDL